MRVKQNITAKIIPLLVLLGVAVTLGACSVEQVPPSQTITTYSSNAGIVRKVQRALRTRGYYTGRGDGFLGQNTALAIQRFQVDHDQIARPYIDRELLVSLGIK
jgi:peptidoglycan hydrolase-like protein with peptidoglycan-binding domain